MFRLAFLFIFSIQAFGSMIQIKDFGDNPGNLEMYLYLPKTFKAKSVVILNHGCTQNGKDFFKTSGWAKVAKEKNLIVIAPTQKKENNDKLCFRWFEKEHYTKNSGEQKSIISMLEFVKKNFRTTEKVFVNGISAGGATTSNLLGNYPELFTAGAVIAGVHYGCAKNLNTAGLCMFTPYYENSYFLASKIETKSKKWPRVMIIHGLKDETVFPLNASNSTRQWLGVRGDFISYFDPSTVTKYDNRYERVFSDKVKTVVFYELDHAWPIDESSKCGTSAPYVKNAGYCGVKEISNFFNL
jgi:poly(hydroxyalkanoate) depolymerase family esterase